MSNALRVLFVAFLYLRQSHQASLEQQACINAKHPQHCISSIRKLHLEENADRVSAARASMESVQSHLKQLLRTILKVGSSHPSVRDCVELLEDASNLVSKSMSNMLSKGNNHIEDVHTWMSGALTYYTTCIDGFSHNYKPKQQHLVHQYGDKVDKSLSNVLSLLSSLRRDLVAGKRTGHSFDHGRLAKTIGNFTFLPNITVAKDGSGSFNTIAAALASVPKKSKTKFVIYIKAGIYFEYIEVPNIQNLVLLGDGIGKTIVTGNKSVQDPNITTYTSATFVVKATGMIAQDITFQNTAGAESHQAVAVRVTADQVTFFRCSFEGYQDTLYAHSFRQFYTQCDIYGTVDYIFGNAAAVFQNCNLYARLPLEKQKNTYTAQGRTDPNQNTGFAFQSCNIEGVSELMNNISSFPTYLGRPWKEYSVTVFLKCYESSVLYPAGWLEWSGDFALTTLFYGEYFCYGPGSLSGKRVNWSTEIYDSSFANQYTVASLLASEWLSQTNLPYTLGL